MSKMIFCKYYKPTSIFGAADDSEIMTGKNNFELAEAFYNIRHKQNASEAANFHKNAGAVQLFNKDGIIQATKAYGAMSEGINNINHKTTSLGHSERILMRNVLDDFIKEKKHEEEFLPPSSRHRSGNSKEIPFEILDNLQKEAREYKIYLIANNTIVKMWSELQACGNGTAVKYGGGGFQFINEIFPTNSQYGYIAKRHELHKKACDDFKSAYENNTLINDEEASGAEEVSSVVVLADMLNNTHFSEFDIAAAIEQGQDW